MTPPPSPPPFEIPWGPIATTIGIAASLVWNLVNTRLASSIKKQDRRLDEFKRIRTRLDSVVDELRSIILSLRSLSLTARNKANFTKELNRLNQSLAESDRKVRVVLDDLSRSRYVHGNSWGDVMSPHWDNALGSLNGGYSSVKALSEQKASVADSAAHLESMIAAIEKRLEEEMSKYASQVRD